MELTNHQRKYLGLRLVHENWEKTFLNDTVSVYFDHHKIVKVVNDDPKYYVEYDSDIDTRERRIILPKTDRGKEKQLTVANLLKVKGSGVQFTGSWQGGGISVYDFNTKAWLIRSHGEDNTIKSKEDVHAWIDKFIQHAPANHFSWLKNKLLAKKPSVRAKEGDIFAFPLGSGKYAFAHNFV